MRKTSLIIIGLLLSAHFALADTTWVSGPVSGVWTAAGSPYVIDSAWVEAEDTLTVEGGVEITFQNDDYIQLWVYGCFFLDGTVEDSIVVNMASDYWAPVQGFYNPWVRIRYTKFIGMGDWDLNTDSVEISHCRMDHQPERNYGFFILGDYCEIRHLETPRRLMVNSGTGIISNVVFGETVSSRAGYLEVDSLFYEDLGYGYDGDLSHRTLFNEATVHIRNCQMNDLIINFSYVPGGSAIVEDILLRNDVVIQDCYDFHVRNCVADKFYVTGGGEVVGCTVRKINNVRSDGGIVVRNNTFISDRPCEHTYLLQATGAAEIQVYNNIFYACLNDMNVFSDISDVQNPPPSYNLTCGMADPWQGRPTGPGNIDADPLFDPNSEMRELQYGSPAIDAGDPGLTDPDGSRSDMGVCWWDHRYDHPPIIGTSNHIETGWGEPFVLTLSASDEGWVSLAGPAVLPFWLAQRRSFDDVSRTIYSGRVPFGAAPFVLPLTATDAVGQTDHEEIFVDIYPASTLRDTVSGVLTREHSPYVFFYEVVIPAGDSLIIEPGVELLGDSLNFCTPRIYVFGRLIAEGTAQDSIYILPRIGEELGGIFVYDSLASASFEYCVLQGTSIRSRDNQGMSIRHCFFDYGGILAEYLRDSLIVRNTEFVTGGGVTIFGTEFVVDGCVSDVLHGGVTAYYESSGTVSNSWFLNFEGDYIDIRFGSSVLVERCVFENNQEWGIILATIDDNLLTAEIYHNTFINAHDRFVSITQSGEDHVYDIKIKNNIFWSSDDYIISILGDTVGLTVSNNCFWDYERLYRDDIGFEWPELGELVQVNDNGDSTDIYGNIILDPLFMDSVDWTLSEISPCIDAGYDYGQDFNGTAPDMGYREFVPPVEPEQDNGDPRITKDLSLAAYPNPFNNETVIRFAVPEDGVVNLKVYNILGREVLKPLDGFLEKGEHRVFLHGGDLSSGVYFVRLSTSAGSRTAKLALIR